MKTSPARLPVWLWVAPLVLGLHLLLFWALSGQPALPLAAPVRRRAVSPSPTPAGFGTRETTERDPQTGETVTTREFTVPARLATPSPSP